jgi:hypothetical protein
MNQYLVFLLARQSAPAYMVIPTTESAEAQRAGFDQLRAELAAASQAEIETLLEARPPVLPERALPQELQERLGQRLTKARASAAD